MAGTGLAGPMARAALGGGIPGMGGGGGGFPAAAANALGGGGGIPGGGIPGLGGTGIPGMGGGGFPGSSGGLNNTIGALANTYNRGGYDDPNNGYGPGYGGGNYAPTYGGGGGYDDGYGYGARPYDNYGSYGNPGYGHGSGYGAGPRPGHDLYAPTAGTLLGPSANSYMYGRPPGPVGPLTTHYAHGSYGNAKDWTPTSFSGYPNGGAFAGRGSIPVPTFDQGPAFPPPGRRDFGGVWGVDKWGRAHWNEVPDLTGYDVYGNNNRYKTQGRNLYDGYGSGQGGYAPTYGGGYGGGGYGGGYGGGGYGGGYPNYGGYNDRNRLLSV